MILVNQEVSFFIIWCLESQYVRTSEQNGRARRAPHASTQHGVDQMAARIVASRQESLGHLLVG